MFGVQKISWRICKGTQQGENKINRRPNGDPTSNTGALSHLRVREMSQSNNSGMDFLALATANPLLGQLSERDLRSLLACSTVVTIAGGERLVRQGAPSEGA